MNLHCAASSTVCHAGPSVASSKPLCRDAAKDHARARKQLAGVVDNLAQAQDLRDHQEQALTEAQQSAEETTQAGPWPQSVAFQLLHVQLDSRRT